MPTILTGRDVTLTIDTADYAPQTLLAKVNVEERRETFETLAARTKKHMDEDGTLELSLLTDWGQASGVCAALWDAADTAPDTPLSFSMEVGGDTFAGEVYPIKPPAGGEGNTASEETLSLPIATLPTRTAAI